MTTPSPDFVTVYELGRSPVLRELEHSVLGSDYGGTSWTTKAEALQIGELLGLSPQTSLLDVGAGSGWPGLFLARVTGCKVVLVDLPLVALQIACERAISDGLGERCRLIVADGAALPFTDGAFDAISHSDVLCCMDAKLAMLQACRRVARAGAKMVFSVIAPTAGLSESERKMAIASGPSFVDTPSDYAVSLRRSGWRLLERLDVTTEFSRSLLAGVEGVKARSDAIIRLLGPDEFRDRLQSRETTLAAIEHGLLKRELFVALCPGK